MPRRNGMPRRDGTPRRDCTVGMACSLRFEGERRYGRPFAAWRGAQALLLGGLFASGLACASADGGSSGMDEPSLDADAGTPDAATHPIGELGKGLSTLIGDSRAGLVDGPRESSLLNNPVNVLVGSDGSIYVADFDNGAIRVVSPDGNTRTLVRQEGFSRPFGMAFTPAGEFYVQTDHNLSGELKGALWRVSLDTGLATLVRADLGRVRGLASLSDGRLVIADKFAATVRIYDPQEDRIEELAGLAGSPGYADGSGSAARFAEPLDVVVAENDDIYLADSANHRIRKITLAGLVSTVAGNGQRASTDGPALSASFDTPVGLAIDSEGGLYVSEFASGRTRKLSEGLASTVAGSTQGFADDPDPLSGKLHVCEGLDLAPPYLYVADGNGGTDEAFHRVRRLELGQ